MNSKDYENEVIQSQSGTLRIGSEIDSGAEGRVFAVDNYPSKVVKIFHTENRSRKENKIRAMVKRSNKPPDQTKKEENVRSIVWPQEVVWNKSTKEFLGYMMAKENLSQSDTALTYAIKELDWTGTNELFRMGLALNLTIIIKEIHQLGHAIGDFNEENIHVYNGYIKLFDCDGFHISDGDDTYPSDTYSKRYSPPEKRPKKLEDVKKADYFCLSVYIFQFLMEGDHPYRAIGPDATGGNWRNKIEQNEFPYANSTSEIEPPPGMQQKYDRLPKEIKSKFYNCFVDGKRNKNKRPSPKEWKQTLEKLTKQNSDTVTDSSTNNSGITVSDSIKTSNNTTADSGPKTSKPSPIDQETQLLQSVRTEVKRLIYYVGWLLVLIIVIYVLSVGI